MKKNLNLPQSGTTKPTSGVNNVGKNTTSQLLENFGLSNEERLEVTKQVLSNPKLRTIVLADPELKFTILMHIFTEQIVASAPSANPPQNITNVLADILDTTQMSGINKGLENPDEQYFKDILGEESEDFLKLKEMVTDSFGAINWKKLREFAIIKNGEIEGIYWESSLQLRNTKAQVLWRIIKIKGNISGYVFTDLGDLEEIGGDGNFSESNITTLGKLKKARRLNLRKIPLKNIGALEEVEELYLSGANIEGQLDAIMKINSGKLSVSNKATFGGNVEGIEKLFIYKSIPGSLDLAKVINLKILGELEEVLGDLNMESTSIELQLEVMKKIKNGDLLVKGTTYFNEKVIEQYFEDILGKESEDFLRLKKMIEETGGPLLVNWNRLYEAIIIKDGKIRDIARRSDGLKPEHRPMKRK